MLGLKWIKDKIQADEYFYTLHGDRERQNDNFSLSEVEYAILKGILLESYEDTGRGESCLIAGFTKAGKPLHVVCGKRGNSLVIITVYLPRPPKFITPYERSK